MEINDHLQREAELMCRLDKSWTPYNVYIESWCEIQSHLTQFHFHPSIYRLVFCPDVFIKKTGMVIIKSVFIKWAKYYFFLLEIHVLMTCLGVCISLIYLRYLLTIFHLSYFTIWFPPVYVLTNLILMMSSATCDILL